MLDSLVLAMLGICIAAMAMRRWIGVAARRYFRLAAVATCLLQIVVIGLRPQLLPAYCVAFVLLVVSIGDVWHASASDAPKPIEPANQPVRPLVGIAVSLMRWLAITGAAVALTVSIALCALFPRYEYPVPSGRYAVGATELRLTDSSRVETNTKVPNDYRELSVRVSYPAATKTSADLPRDSVADFATLLLNAFLSNWQPGSTWMRGATPLWARVRTNAAVGAPLPERQRYPVLVYSHGLGFGPEQNTVLVEELVSHGYIVMAINHAGLSAHFERSYGAVIGLDRLVQQSRAVASTDDARRRWSALTRQLNRTGLSIDARSALIRERATVNPRATQLLDDANDLVSRDQRFILNELHELQMSDPILGGHLDLDRIGIFGMSLGGTASLRTCTVDSRCRGGINMDGFQELIVELPPLQTPFMYLASDWQRNYVVPHDRSAAASYIVRIAGAAHFGFTDMPLAMPAIQELDRRGFEVIGTLDRQRMSNLVTTYVLAFFEQSLRGRRQPLLMNPAIGDPDVELTVK